MLKAIPVSIYRGGTSRALIFHQSDLPETMEDQDKVVLDAMGSGHPLQINGLGGGNPLTSKVAVIGPPSVKDADIDYTFLYPSVNERIVDKKGNCGNISSAVGPFAVNEGLVKATGEDTSVVIYNTNTRKLIRSTFKTQEGMFQPEGNFRIDGVPGTGSKVTLEFLGDPAQPLLPTGNITDDIEVPAFKNPVKVTIVSAGNLTVFFNMSDIGVKGEPAQWPDDTTLWQRMEEIRGAAAMHLGMVGSLTEARQTSPAVPKIVAVGPPADYVDLQGRTISENTHNLRVLMAAMGSMHRSFAVTGTVATAAAAELPGSIVNQNRVDENESELILGHPSGTISAVAKLFKRNNSWEVQSVAVLRTARLILQGKVFI